MRWRIKTERGEREREGRGGKKIGFRMRGSAVQPVGAAALDRPSCDGESCLHPQHKRVIHGGDAERGRSGGIHHAKRRWRAAAASYMSHEERMKSSSSPKEPLHLLIINRLQSHTMGPIKLSPHVAVLEKK